MPQKSLRQIRADLQRIRTDRYVAVKLEVQAPDGETIFTVGGWWDRLSHRYVERETECPARIVKLKKSQVQPARAVARYLEQRRAGDDARMTLLMLMGKRGGGKTWFGGGLLVVACALAFPFTWQMASSITTKQSRELKKAISQVAAPHWIANEVEDLRDPRTEFITATTMLWMTSKNPEALRQALLPFELVIVNEGQDQGEDVFTNGIGAIRNTGGLMGILTNPPTEGSGDWVAITYKAILADPKQRGAAFILDPADNDAVHKPTMETIGYYVKAVNREKYEADYLGEVKLSGNVGYPGFSRGARMQDASGRWVGGHVAEPVLPVVGLDGQANPGSGWIDETRKITAKLTNTEAGFDYVAGADFQTDPGCCAAVGKLYRLPTGELVLWIRELVGSTGTEADLTLALNSRGYYPGAVDYEGRRAASLLLVGDATGARQNAEHRKRDPYSYTRLRAEGGWTILPPFMIRNRQGASTPMNPLVEESRKQMKALHQAGLLIYAPACAEPASGFPSLLDSLERAKVNGNGKFEKKQHYTHGPDGVRYLAWRFLPRGVVPPAGPGLDEQSENEIRAIRLYRS
jgi:hypothetical protein